MDTSTNGWRHGSQINDEVPNLAEKVVLVGIPVAARGVVWVSVDDSHTLETGCTLDRWGRESIANELGVVVLDDRLAYGVCTWWEVN